MRPGAATTVLNQPILTYDNSVGNNHTIDWAGFDPTATGDARKYLYISTGDGAFGNAYNGGAVSGDSGLRDVLLHPAPPQP